MKFIPSPPMGSAWLKAAVTGSLWASVEIIAGSFLHNLRVPMAGATLSFIGVYLLVASVHIWKQHGLIWRAGLICALMKSISPSAIILGPMIGIMTEALLLEMTIRLLGRNPVAYLAGGALAVFSTLAHKVVSLLIMYGFDIVRILENLYRYSVKQVGLEQLTPELLISIVAGIYLAAGMVAAILGYLSAKRYISGKSAQHSKEQIVLQPRTDFLPEPEERSYPQFYLLFNLAMIIISMIVISMGDPVLSWLIPLGYIIFCATRYPRAMRRFRNRLIWIQFVVITLATAFLWNGFSGGSFFSFDGLVAGVKMIGRAVVVIAGYAAISVEMRNPLIRSVMFRKGFSNLYKAIGLAFSALPEMVAALPVTKTEKKRKLSFSTIFRKAEMILSQFEAQDSARPPVFIITGAIRSGKTTFASRIAEKLREDGYITGGFLAPGIDENGKRLGFQLLDLQTGQSFPLCHTTPNDAWEKAGPFYFDPQAMERGRLLLAPEAVISCDLICIDEIGPMELRGAGWSEETDRLTRHQQTPMLWVVRETLADQVLRRWNTGDVIIFEAGKDSTEEAYERIIQVIRKQSQR